MGPSDLLSQGNFLCRSAFLLSGSVGWGARAFVFRLGRNRPDPCFDGTLCPESAYACRLRERNPMTLSLKSRMVRHPGSNLWMSIFAMSFIDVLPAGLPDAQATARGSGSSQTTERIPPYDLAKEIQVQGTLEGIEPASTNLPIGTHILIQTAQGIVDAHLGNGRAASPNYLDLLTGESVTVRGMIESAGGKDIVLARILGTPNHVFILRDQYGIPVRGTAKTSSVGSNALKGGL